MKTNFKAFLIGAVLLLGSLPTASAAWRNPAELQKTRIESAWAKPDALKIDFAG